MKTLTFKCAVCLKRYEIEVADPTSVDISFLCSQCDTPLTVRTLEWKNDPDRREQ